MKGYPKIVATKQDFLNLLAVPEFKEQALTDLQAVYDLQDDTVEIVKSYDKDEAGKMINVVMETVQAPMPKWKRMGFKSRKDVLALSAASKA